MLLQKEWYSKLAKEGFVDIENEKEYLTQYDRRTISFDNREAIYQFFVALDHYLTEHEDLPPLERQVLSLYSQGIYLNQIGKQLSISIGTVKKVIGKYKVKVLTYNTVCNLCSED